MQHLAAGHQRIRRRSLERDLPVAVAVDPVFEDIAGQHLNHPDLSGPCAGRARRVEIAVFIEFDSRQHLRAEKLGSAAIMGQRHQRVRGVEIPLKRAVVRLESPEREDNVPVDAELLFDAVEGRIMLSGIRAPALDPII